MIAAMLAADLDEIDDTLAAELEVAAQDAPAPVGRGTRLPRSDELATGELGWWLARASEAAVTGRLWISGAGLERSFFLDSGRLVLAAGSGPGDRLGEFLVEQGRVTAGARDRALAAAQAGGRRLGLVLVEQGALASAELLGALRAHQEHLVVTAVAAAIAPGAGVIGFDPGLLADRRRARLLRHPALLVWEGLTTLADAAPLWQRLGGPDSVLRAVVADDLGQDLGENRSGVVASLAQAAPVLKLLALFDGIRSTGRVAAASALGEGEFLALAATARAFALLLPAGARGGPAPIGERDRQLAGERLLARFGLARAGDYFEFLGLSAEAGDREVARALAQVNREIDGVEADPELASTLAEEMALVRAVRLEAARVLGDGGLRARYRAGLGFGDR